SSSPSPPASASPTATPATRSGSPPPPKPRRSVPTTSSSAGPSPRPPTPSPPTGAASANSWGKCRYTYFSCKKSIKRTFGQNFVLPERVEEFPLEAKNCTAQGELEGAKPASNPIECPAKPCRARRAAREAPARGTPHLDRKQERITNVRS